MNAAYRPEDRVAAGELALWCEAPPVSGRAYAGPHLTVHGWAYGPAGVESVTVALDGGPGALALLGLERPDIAAHFGIPEMGRSGFVAMVDLDGATPGLHTLEVIATGPAGEEAGLSVGFEIDAGAAFGAWDREHRPERALRTGPLHRRRARSSAALSPRDQMTAALERVAATGSGAAVGVSAGGELTHGALDLVLEEILVNGAELVYGGDRSRAPEGGGPGLMRPGFSPQLLACTDYLGPVVAFGPEAARIAVGAGCAGSAYDAALALSDARLPATRLTETLFEWDGPGRPALEAGEMGLAALAGARGLEAVVQTAPPGAPRNVGWTGAGHETVGIVIPSAGSEGLIERCLASLAGMPEPVPTVVVAWSGDAEGARRLEDLYPGITVTPVEGPFNFSEACNSGAAAAGQPKFLVFLNDDVEALDHGWLRGLLEQAAPAGVGAVGAKLLYPDGTVQHGGVAVAPGAASAHHLFGRLPGDAAGYGGLMSVSRECSAVTAACMMVRREAFELAGGFDPRFRLEMGDVDLCLRLRNRGLRVVWTPAAALVHRESVSRGSSTEPEDRRLFRARWGDAFADGDPYYHPAFAPGRSFEFA